ncbi:MAG: CoA-binding protein [Elusimicrobiota bacterium]
MSDAEGLHLLLRVRTARIVRLAVRERIPAISTNSEETIENILSGSSFAVIGSFKDKSKYSYRILLNLIALGKEVYPVNPRGGTVEDLKCYKSVTDIPADVNAVTIVTPPEVTEKIVAECKEKGIKNVWLQPGAQSKRAVDYCNENGINVIYNTCMYLRL